jgi:hypothetical protein
MKLNKIAYFRIQDQVRGMGLGRKALKEMILILKNDRNIQPEEIKIDKETMKKFKSETKKEDMDAFDSELQKTDADMLLRMLTSVTTEIRGDNR